MLRRLEPFAFFVLLGVVALRPLHRETYDSSRTMFSQAMGELADPTPLYTLSLDGLILVCSLVLLAARLRSPVRRYRSTGLEFGLLLIAAASLISCWYAPQQRLAINASIDWLCGIVLATALAQAIHTPLRRRLLLAVLAGGAIAQAIQCVDQDVAGFDDTWEHYLSIKESLWARQGVDLDSSRVEMFERRLQSREATGYLAHSSLAGSHLVLIGLVLAGFTLPAFGRWRRCTGYGRLATAGCAVCVGLTGYACYLTGNRGAWFAAAAALVAWIIAHRAARVIERHPVRTIVAGWGMVAVAAAVVVGYGVEHDGLPGVSLTFRWQYWCASAEMIKDHPVRGVGRENFGREYVRYKSIHSPEEVANPHNLFVQAAAEWGIIGLAGLLAMLVGSSIQLISRHPAGPRRERAPPPHRGAGPPADRVAHQRQQWDRAGMLVSGLCVMGFIVAGRLLLLRGADPSFVYYTTVMMLFSWGVGFAVVSAAGTGAGLPGWGDRSLRSGVLASLLAFLVADTISFALFQPQTMTVFFAVLALGLSHDGDLAAEPRRPLPPGKDAHDRTTHWRFMCIIPTVFTPALLLMSAWTAWTPVARSGAALATARALAVQPCAGGVDAHPAYQAFAEAAALDPLDPTPLVERAYWLAFVADSQADPAIALGLAVESIDRAILRDPHNAALWKFRCSQFLRLAGESVRPDALDEAVRSARRAVELYPQSPPGLVFLGDAELAAGEQSRSAPLLQQAITHYEQALVLDNERLSWERIRRLREREVDAIRNRIARARVSVEEIRSGRIHTR